MLSVKNSGRFFKLVCARRTVTRTELLRTIAGSLLSARHTVDRIGRIYLNVGHTGLDEPTLPEWIERNELRAIFLVHDLIPLTHPEHCRPEEARRHRQRMSNVLASAHGIIGNSQATLNEMTTFANKQGQPMPPAVAAWISGRPSTTASARPPISTPYFVILGTIEARKNHALLLEIWRELVGELGADAPTLVVIGQRGWEADRAQAMLDRPSDFAGRMIELNTCGDEELAGWIAGARALLMPSFAEGFGLPIIEALALGTPVIASDLSVFREIADGIPTHVDPHDRNKWASWIRAFLGNHPERARQVGRMNDYRAPDWDRHFAIVDKWLAALGVERRLPTDP